MRLIAAKSLRARSSCGCRHDALGVEAGLLADRHAQRLPARRGREPVGRRSRPSRARTGDGARRRNDVAVPLGDGRRARWVALRRQRQRRQGLQDRRAPARPTTFFDTTELEVHALALAPDGTLYAATSPDGRIYKIDRSGKGAPFFDPEDKYIWSLALDQQGNLYAGTGEKGLIYKITPDGKGSAFYATKATHVITLDVRAQRAAAGRHRRARDGCSASTRPARRFCCSIRRFRRFAPSASIRRATSISPR